MTANHIPEPFLQQILDDVAKDLGYKKPRFDVSLGTKAGDNYAGLVYRVLLREEDAEKDAEPQSLIFKAMPRSAKRREALKINLLFETEANMYNVVLPAYASLMKEKGMLVKDNVYPGSPKCYAARIGEGEDVLVLQDMRPLGFQMHDRKVGLDVEHCRLVMSALARLHASSLAFEHHRPKEFERLKGCVQENCFYKGNPIGEQLNAMVLRTYDYIKGRYPPGSPEYDKLKGFLDNYMDNMCDLVMPDPEGGNVICHGDCWNNNLLFKYSEDTGRPTAVTLLDWQVSRYASPTLDLAYFLYMGTATAMRDAHMQSLLRLYHTDLSTTLRDLGVDADKVYSWERFQRQFTRYAIFGVSMALSAIPILLTEKAKDQDDVFENGGGVGDMFEVDDSNPETVDRMVGFAKDVVSLGFL